MNLIDPTGRSLCVAVGFDTGHPNSVCFDTGYSCICSAGGDQSGGPVNLDFVWFTDLLRGVVPRFLSDDSFGTQTPYDPDYYRPPFPEAKSSAGADDDCATPGTLCYQTFGPPSHHYWANASAVGDPRFIAGWFGASAFFGVVGGYAVGGEVFELGIDLTVNGLVGLEQVGVPAFWLLYKYWNFSNRPFDFSDLFGWRPPQYPGDRWLR